MAGLLAAFGVLGQALPVRALVRLIPRAFYPLAVVATIAVTYLPATLRQFQQVREAQAVRGHALRRLRDWLPLFMPLLVGGLERALQLSEAMTACGFASQGQRNSPGSGLAAPGHAGGRAAAGGRLAAAPGGRCSRYSWLALGIGAGLIGLGLWASGGRYPRSTYRPPPWRLADTLTLLGALLVLAVLWLGSAACGIPPTRNWPSRPSMCGWGWGCWGCWGHWWEWVKKLHRRARKVRKDKPTTENTEFTEKDLFTAELVENAGNTYLPQSTQSPQRFFRLPLGISVCLVVCSENSP